MIVTVSKWGNSLAVRIPASEAQKATIKEGDEVDLTALAKGRSIVKKVRKEINFDSLYAQENFHLETDWRQSVGRENVEW